MDPVKQKWFQDINFRKAVDWAIDRKSIINNVVQGVGAPLFTAESLSSIYLNEKLAKGHPRDLNKAREHLKKGGYYLKNEAVLLELALIQFAMETLIQEGFIPVIPYFSGLLK